MLRFFLGLVSVFVLVLPLQASGLKGVVRDARTGEGLPGAAVLVKNTRYSALTDGNGRYEIRNMLAGDYEIRVSYVGYAEQTKLIRLADDQTAIVDFAMTTQTQSLSEVQVMGKLNQEDETASRLSEKNADNIVTVISAKAMEKSPDINVANVLQRMSGVAIQRSNGSDGAFAVIRGLEPRYSNTLINGIKIASPDEKNRFIPLDIIPSDLLKRIEITKSLTPNMEGDAIGGTVNLVMKDAPDTTLFRVNGSLGYSQLFLDRSFESFSRQDIQKKSPAETHPAGYAAVPADFTLNNVEPFRKQAPPTYTGSITYGRRFRNNKLGFIVSANTQNQFYGSDGFFTVPISVDERVTPISYSAPRRFSNQQRNNGVIIHLDYNINSRNKIGLYQVLLVSDFTQTRTSVDTNLRDQRDPIGFGTGTTHRIYRTLTNRQVVENLKLEGRHQLAQHMLLDWALVYSNAFKNAPDRSTLDVDLVGIRQQDLSVRYSPVYYDNNTRIWQHNDDKDYTALLNLSYQAEVRGRTIDLKGGAFYRTKSRYNRQNVYVLKSLPDPNTGVKPIFTNIYNQNFFVYDAKGSFDLDANNYNADEQVAAGYIQGKTEIGRLQILTGVRVESTHQHFATKVVSYVPDLPTAEDISYLDFLPSLHLKYVLNGNQNLRFSYFKSISRPNYYELVPYVLPGTDFDEVGNPNLKHTQADNIDIRYEIFPNGEDYLAGGIFYKNLINPIEYIYQGFGNSQRVIRPENFAPSAVNAGFEIAFAKYIQNFGLTGNYTYTSSSVNASKTANYSDSGKYGKAVTLYPNEQRTLQGQSKHIVNASLIYRSITQGLFIQFSYQFLGKTLRDVSPFYNVDYYQIPQSMLALSAEKNIKKHFVVFGKFNNLLNTKTTLKSNNSDLIIQQDTFKQSYQIGFRYNL
jgi:TonB-dependent receptor